MLFAPGDSKRDIKPKLKLLTNNTLRSFSKQHCARTYKFRGSLQDRPWNCWVLMSLGLVSGQKLAEYPYTPGQGGTLALDSLTERHCCSANTHVVQVLLLPEKGWLRIYWIFLRKPFGHRRVPTERVRGGLDNEGYRS